MFLRWLKGEAIWTIWTIAESCCSSAVVSMPFLYLMLYSTFYYSPTNTHNIQQCTQLISHSIFHFLFVYRKLSHPNSFSSFYRFRFIMCVNTSMWWWVCVCVCGRVFPICCVKHDAHIFVLYLCMHMYNYEQAYNGACQIKLAPKLFIIINCGTAPLNG